MSDLSTLRSEALGAVAQAADLAALDAAWIEQEVTFGPGAARDNCPVDRMAERLRVATETNPGVRP